MMIVYTTKRLWIHRSQSARKDWENLLEASNLSTQEQTDYTVGIYKGDDLVATGSYAGNVIKCVAVHSDYQSENFLTDIVVHLMDQLRSNGSNHYFVYTCPKNSVYFKSLGFNKIVETSNVTFMEFGHPNFEDYLSMLSNHKKEGNNGAVVMNANPITNGHLHLIEEIAKRSDYVYVFVLSEDRSEFNDEERMMLVKRATADMSNVIVLPTNDYMVSSATFPSYFLRDRAQESVARIQATVDATLFKERVAPVLNIKHRLVGKEPYSRVTEIYNESMSEVFQDDLELEIIPRLEVEGEVISATKVRKALSEGHPESIKNLVPSTTYDYIQNKK